MPAETSARRTDALQKEWWLRVLMVLQSPKSVFQAMRDDSDEAVEARLDDRLRSPTTCPSADMRVCTISTPP